MHTSLLGASLRAALFLSVLIPTVAAGSINRFESKTIAIRPYVETAGYGYEIRNPLTGHHVDWQPNTASVARIYAYLYGFFGVGYGTRGTLSDQDLYRKGETDYEDWRFTFDFPSINLAVNYQKFTGFYTKSITLPSTEPLVQSREMQAENGSANLTWIWSPNAFSLQAALDQTVRQESSGGSWLLGVAASAVRFADNAPLIPASMRSQFGIDQNIQKAQFASALVKGGYGHTFVFARSFYLTAMIMIGFGPQTAKYSDGTTEKQIDSQASKTDLLISTGYNGESFFMGLTTMIDSTSYKTESVEFPSQLTSGQLFIGLRL